MIASFTHGRGQCSICLARFDGNHLNEGHFINSVYQSDYLNFHYANWVLSEYRGSVHIIIKFHMKQKLTMVH